MIPKRRILASSFKMTTRSVFYRWELGQQTREPNDHRAQCLLARVVSRSIRAAQMSYPHLLPVIRVTIATPTEALDQHLSNRDLTFAVRDRLGVDIYRTASRSPFCNVVQDLEGNQSKGCMAGGDATIWHNAIRGIAFSHARAGTMDPYRTAEC